MDIFLFVVQMQIIWGFSEVYLFDQAPENFYSLKVLVY